MVQGVPDTPIYDLLFRRHLGAVYIRRTVLPETINGHEDDLLTCADLFWGVNWWREPAGRTAAA